MKHKKGPRPKGYDLRTKPIEPISSCSFDVSEARLAGDVVVETRGTFPLSRPGDLARSLFGERIIR